MYMVRATTNSKGMTGHTANHTSDVTKYAR